MKWCIVLFLFQTTFSFAQSGDVTGHLKVDQLGYPTYAEKICVINDPVTGYDDPVYCDLLALKPCATAQ